MAKLINILLIFWICASRAEAQTDADVQALMRNHQFEKAIVRLQNCSTISCRLDLAYCQVRLGKIKEAIENFQTILSQEPTNTQAMLGLANLYEKSSKLYQAKNVYQSLLKIDSLNAFVHRSFATLCQRLNQDSLAREHLKKSISLNANDVESIVELGKLYLKIDSVQQTKTLIKKGILCDSSYILTWQLNARVNYRESNFKEVLSSIKKTMALGDTTLGYQQLLGYSYFHLDSISQAITCFERVLAVEDSSEPVFYYLGLCYTKLKEDDKALQYFQQAIKAGLSEELPKYYEQIGFINEVKSRYGIALEAYEKAFEFSEKDDYLYLIARVNDWKSKNKEKAVKLYERYLSSKNKKNVAYINLATTRLKELEVGKDTKIKR
jgi:tetratricopeptide (TPR) repeat protein